MQRPTLLLGLVGAALLALVVVGYFVTGIGLVFPLFLGAISAALLVTSIVMPRNPKGAL